jgi:hypothetical protein
MTRVEFTAAVAIPVFAATGAVDGSGAIDDSGVRDGGGDGGGYVGGGMGSTHRILKTLSLHKARGGSGSGSGRVGGAVVGAADGFTAVSTQTATLAASATSVADAAVPSDGVFRIDFMAQRFDATGYAPITLGMRGQAVNQVAFEPFLLYVTASTCVEPRLYETAAGDCITCPAGGVCPGGGRVWVRIAYATLCFACSSVFLQLFLLLAQVFYSVKGSRSRTLTHTRRRSHHLSHSHSSKLTCTSVHLHLTAASVRPLGA